MTDRLEEIRKRCDAATPGPWKYPGCLEKKIAIAKDPSNAEFIAHSREDIPYLLEQLDHSIAIADSNIALSEELEYKDEKITKLQGMLVQLTTTALAEHFKSGDALKKLEVAKAENDLLEKGLRNVRKAKKVQT